MAYKLAEGEGFSVGIKRIALEQIDKAIENLKPTVRSKDEAVHDARVCIKKIRALLRLVKYSLGNKTYEAEDKSYRDAARMLSRVRDSTAMVEIIDKLSEHFSDQLSGKAFTDVRAGLNRSRKTRQTDRKKAMVQAAKSLRQARRRVKGWPDTRHHLSITRGLKRVFNRGRVQFAAAYDKPSIESFHEWRKEVKHLLYETGILKPLWQRAMKASAAELKILGKYLSENHDLALLRKRVLEQLEESDDQTEIEALVALIDQRRNELQVKARSLGARIYVESPRVFADRIEAYWQAWRSEIKVDPIAVG